MVCGSSEENIEGLDLETHVLEAQVLNIKIYPTTQLIVYC